MGSSKIGRFPQRVRHSLPNLTIGVGSQGPHGVGRNFTQNENAYYTWGWGRAGQSPWGASSRSACLGSEEEVSVCTLRHSQTVEQNCSVEPRRPEPFRGNAIKGKSLGCPFSHVLFIILCGGSHTLGVSKEPSGYLIWLNSVGFFS